MDGYSGSLTSFSSLLIARKVCSVKKADICVIGTSLASCLVGRRDITLFCSCFFNVSLKYLLFFLRI